ncbi:signal peptidase I [Cellulomonas denverensis]|nr:signal peptidase I [Cellulomonas denverensis]
MIGGPTGRMRGVLRFVRLAGSTMLVGVAGLALLAGVLVPRIAGATPYVVLTDSMAPGMPSGSLVVVRPVAAEDVAVGDVITYQLRSGEEQVVTHRVEAIGTRVGGERVFTTRGDANTVADLRPVRAVQVRGERWYAVPYLGRVSALLTGSERQAVATVLAAVLLGYGAWQVVQARRERGRPMPAPGVAT